MTVPRLSNSQRTDLKGAMELGGVEDMPNGEGVYVEYLVGVNARIRFEWRYGSANLTGIHIDVEKPANHKPGQLELFQGITVTGVLREMPSGHAVARLRPHIEHEIVERVKARLGPLPQGKRGVAFTDEQWAQYAEAYKALTAAGCLNLRQALRSWADPSEGTHVWNTRIRAMRERGLIPWG